VALGKVLLFSNSRLPVQRSNEEVMPDQAVSQETNTKRDPLAELTDAVTKLTGSVSVLAAGMGRVELRLGEVEKQSRSQEQAVQMLASRVSSLESQARAQRSAEPRSKLRSAPLSADGVGIYGYAGKIY
jgi:hypothetical protein